MDSTFITIAVVLVLVVIGVFLAPIFARRKRTERLQDQFGSECDHTVELMGNEKKAHKEFEERQKHVDSLDIQPLAVETRDRYLADWAAIQSRFVDEPGQAIVDVDRLIMEIMQTRAYPVSNFEQWTADISVQYPALVSNYRAAKEIATKNKQNEANTEELRQALIYYRSLFEELLETEKVKS